MALFTIDSTITINPAQWAAAGYGDLTSENLYTYLMYALGTHQNALPAEPLTMTLMKSGDTYRIRAVVDITSTAETLGFGNRTDKQETEAIWQHAVQDFSRIARLTVKAYTPEPQ